MLEILYYPEGNRGPVREYLTALTKDRPKAFARLAVDLEVLGVEGLRSQRVSVRPMGGGLWELKRLHEGVQYRVFFGVRRGAVWLLHSLEKKSAKTPKSDLELARRRLKEVMGR